MTKDEQKRAVDVLQEHIDSLEVSLKDGEGPGEVFTRVTGLPSGLVPMMTAFFSEKNNVDDDIIKDHKNIAYMIFDLVILSAAIGYAHGKKVSQIEATAGDKASSNAI